MRTEFIANVSHELRTPLTSIKGFLETLMDGALEDRDTAVRFLSIISAETERMTGLIGDLFSLSNIESGKIVPAKEPVRMQDIVEKVFAVFSRAAGEKGIELVSRISPDFPVITVDADMITRVFVNLVDNAIKFTGTGDVAVSAELFASGTEPLQIRFKVTDTGIGIGRDDMNRLFQPFVQLDSGLSRRYEGTGLGLALTKQLVQLLGGSLGARSELGVGSTFSVWLPCRIAPPPPADSLAAPRTQGNKESRDGQHTGG